MPWVRIDDTFPEHPKVEMIGPLAGWLHVCALCYCNRNLTDGFIPSPRVSKLADIPKVSIHVRSLIEAGLWLEEDGGYRISNYLEYQPSKAKVEADREAARKRMAKARAAQKVEEAGDDPFDSSADVLEMFGRTDGERSGELRSTRPNPASDFKESSSALALDSEQRSAAGGWEA